MSAPGTTVPLLPNACPEPPESLLLEVVANQMVGSALEASSMHPKQLEPPCLQTGACHGMTTFLDYCVGAFPPVQLIWAKTKTAQVGNVGESETSRGQCSVGQILSSSFKCIMLGQGMIYEISKPHQQWAQCRQSQASLGHPTLL